jgi:ribosome biogenesis GTPase A
VDLLDFPGSIFYNLSEILGPKRPIFIVGNKVDLIPKDHPDYLNHIKRCLKGEAVKMGFQDKFIKHVALISATTGYGVEELITQLHNLWKYKGDVYLIGCTNVGKSSLFNALLGSDYCKVDASDLVHRATACPWPGTTLRMLKFPILNPSDFRLFLRTKRLQHEFKMKIAENQLRKIQAQKTKSIQHATLIGHIGRTFEKPKDDLNDPAVSSHDGGFSGEIWTLNEKSERLKLSKWCYDTPGVIQQDQVSGFDG